jgi:hypothetical protein
LFSLISGCDYAPTETNYQTVSPQTQDTISIAVKNPNSINLISGTVSIEVEMVLNGHEIRFITGFLDSTQVSLHMPDSTHVEFNTEHYSDGDYTFTLILAASSNTGSIADILGTEVILAAAQYPVRIYNGTTNIP